MARAKHASTKSAAVAATDECVIFLDPDIDALLDAWIAGQPKKIARSDALCRLLEQVLAD